MDSSSTDKTRRLSNLNRVGLLCEHSDERTAAMVRNYFEPLGSASTVEPNSSVGSPMQSSLHVGLPNN